MRRSLQALVAIAGLATLVDYASAEITGAGYHRTPSGTVDPAVYQTPANGRASAASPALEYFGAPRGYAHAQQQAQQRAGVPAPLPVRTAPTAKPFAGYRPSSPITPYLGLDAVEVSTDLPNYFLYVKPQLDQQHINRVQHAEYRHLRQEVRTLGAPGVVTTAGGGIPTTGHSAQFMNNGGYFPATTVRR